MSLYVLVLMFWLDGRWVEYYTPPMPKEQCMAIIKARHKTGAYKHEYSMAFCDPVRDGKEPR